MALGGYPIFSMDNQGTPYLVTGGTSEKLTVRKYNGTAWETVGDTGVNASSLSIAFDSLDNPYIPIYVYDEDLQAKRLKVMKYESDNWVDVSGGESFYGGGDPEATIAFDRNNIPYVLQKYPDSSSGSGSLILSKYESGAWATVGSFEASQGANNPVLGASFALAPDGVPYVTYMKDSKVVVMRYINSTWEPVGDGDFSSSAKAITSIAIDSKGIPYVAYKDLAQGNLVSVMKYDGIWSHVGNVGFSYNSAGKLIDLSINRYDEIYLNFIDVSSTLHVMKYDPES